MAFQESVDVALTMNFPPLTTFEEKIFARFARNWRPPYAAHPIQLEGDGQIAVINAARRMEKKGVLTQNQSCRWYLTKLGEEMAREWKRLNRPDK